MSCGEAERADWDPGGPVQTDRSFTAWTVHISPGCYGLTSYNREICQALMENKEVEKMCVRACMCDECCLPIRLQMQKCIWYNNLAGGPP